MDQKLLNEKFWIKVIAMGITIIALCGAYIFVDRAHERYIQYKIIELKETK